MREEENSGMEEEKLKKGKSKWGEGIKRKNTWLVEMDSIVKNQTQVVIPLAAHSS
tara:strand:+ start:120 stop:284 length:165 start_codon:yes stop_codon:yes gene_type:complete